MEASQQLLQQQQAQRMFLESLSPAGGGATFMQNRLSFTNYPLLIPFVPQGVVTCIFTVALGFFISSFYGWPKMSKTQKDVRNIFVEVLAGCFCALFLRQEWAMESRVIDDEWPIVTGGQVGIVDSRRVHYLKKKFDVAVSPRTALLHFFHGFGANSLSWETVLERMEQRMSDLSSSCVAFAHCVPGFGYSPRQNQPVEGWYYRPIWQAKASLALAEMQEQMQQEQSQRRVLIGHSMGAIAACCAAAAASRKGDDVTVILESGALAMTNTSQNTSTGYEKVNAVERVASWMSLPLQRRASTSASGNLSVLARIKRALIQILVFPFRIALKRILRTTFIWRDALKSMWSKKSSQSVGIDTILRYKLPSMARDFDSELLRFVGAQSHSASHSAVSSNEADLTGPFPSGKIFLAHAASNAVEVSHLDLLTDIVRRGCKVILVHGEEDKVVPCSNSFQLKAEVERRLNIETQGRELESKGSIDVIVLLGLGHVPHEEDPEAFTSILMKHV